MRRRARIGSLLLVAALAAITIASAARTEPADDPDVPALDQHARSAAIATFARRRHVAPLVRVTVDVVDPSTVGSDPPDVPTEIPRGTIVTGRGLAAGERLVALPAADGAVPELVFVADRPFELDPPGTGACADAPRYLVFAGRAGRRVIARLEPDDRELRVPFDCGCEPVDRNRGSGARCARQGPTIPMHGLSLGHVAPRDVEIVDLHYPEYVIEHVRPARCGHVRACK